LETVWVEAISINQGNETEKIAHIPIMKDIYHNANQTASKYSYHRPNGNILKAEIHIDALRNDAAVQGAGSDIDRYRPLSMSPFRLRLVEVRSLSAQGHLHSSDCSIQKVVFNLLITAGLMLVCLCWFCCTLNIFERGAVRR